MKKFMVKSQYLPVVLFIFFFLCIIAQPSYATSPKSVDLVYAMKTQTLSVTIDHYTLSANMHYIESVEIKKNGVAVSKNDYTSQPTDELFTYTYKIPAAKGDVFEVTANCNLWGSTTSTLTVK